MATKERRYQLYLPQEMDEDMNKLAGLIGGDLSEVFNRAMRLYYAVKINQLDGEKDRNTPFLTVVLDDGHGQKTEFTDI